MWATAPTGHRGAHQMELPGLFPGFLRGYIMQGLKMLFMSVAVSTMVAIIAAPYIYAVYSTIAGMFARFN
jgi:hypothetical protein